MVPAETYMQKGHGSHFWVAALLRVVVAGLLLALTPAGAARGAATDIIHDGKITLTLRKVEISEVMEMLSRAARVNILLSDDVKGEVSVNLYDVGVDDAIRSIATSAGYGVERRSGSYFILERDQAGKSEPGGPTRLRTFKVQYSDPEVISGIVKNHLSSYGQVTTLADRRLIIVEDTAPFLARIQALLKEIDRQPRQILIEAKILEVSLSDSESYGLDWARVFESGDAEIGTQGLGSPGSPGLFFNYVTPDVAVFLDALRTRGRTRTLSTPKLLALEDQEAETIIGNRLGYNVTTTIDNVTTTSVEFLESGVIMKVKPSVDGEGRIFLEIHPEVSKGDVFDGLPSQTTTEVTTSMLVESGQTVFIGGLITRNQGKSREGIPILGDIPGIGNLFSNRLITSQNTELVVLVTPYLIDNDKVRLDGGDAARVDAVAGQLEAHTQDIDRVLEKMDYFEDTLDAVRGEGDFRF